MKSLNKFYWGDMKKIFIASDHAGFFLKKKIIEEFKENENFEFIDLGTDCEESCDYPIFAERLVKKIKIYEDSFGVLICGTGIGMSIAANRFPGIRAALCFNKETAKAARRHNNANIIIFGARIIDSDEAVECLRCFSETDFEGGRHARRLNMIDKLVCGE